MDRCDGVAPPPSPQVCSGLAAALRERPGSQPVAMPTSLSVVIACVSNISSMDTGMLLLAAGAPPWGTRPAWAFGQGHYPVRAG